MGKYGSLYDYLLMQKEEVTLTFEEIEKMLGEFLPESADKYGAWWSNAGNDTDNSHVQSESWVKTGYKAYPDLVKKRFYSGKVIKLSLE